MFYLILFYFILFYFIFSTAIVVAQMCLIVTLQYIACLVYNFVSLKLDLIVNLVKCQTGVHYMGIKIFNKLPTYIKNEYTDSTKFISLAKNFLSENSFYSLEEFYNYDTTKYS